MRYYLIPLTLLFFLAATGIAYAGFNYTVQSGDTLFYLGQRFGTTAWSIQQANGLPTTSIRAGQVLWIPSSARTYTVQRGDTLYLIAQRFGVTLAELQTANSWPPAIYPGQVLTIPAARATPVASRGGTVRATREDIMLLARLVYAEARGESYTGQVAVAAVVLNRVKSPSFPNTITGVIFQPGAFTAVSDGQFWLTPDATAIRAAEDALAGWDPTGGALYYWNPARTTSRWIWSRPVIAVYGNHLFAA